MTTKNMNIWDAMYESGAVPVLTVSDPVKAVKAVKAIQAGGTKAVEIAFRVPGAAECIRAVRAACPYMVVAAGTVVTCEQVDEAIEAGAHFAVAPGFDDEVVDYAIKQGLPYVPGIATPSEIMKCVKRGMTVVKFFPCEPLGGLGFIRRMAGPFAQVKFLASAGIHFPNLEEYLDCPSVLCCASGFMCKSSHLENEDWDDVTERCARVTAIARKRLKA